MNYKKPAAGKKKRKTEARTLTSRSASAKSLQNINSGKIKNPDIKPKPLCKVTFRLPREAAPGAEKVTIVGDFNNWNVTQTPMQKLKNGDFKLTLDLPCDREFNFRYLVDTNRWEKDWFADKYVPDDYDEEISDVSA